MHVRFYLSYEISIILDLISGVKSYDCVIIYATLLCTSFHNVTKICKPLVVY